MGVGIRCFGPEGAGGGTGIGMGILCFGPGQVLELGLGLTFFVFEQPVLGLGLMLADFAVVKLVLVLVSALAIPPSAPEMWMEGEDSDLRAWLGSRSRGRIP